MSEEKELKEKLKDTNNLELQEIWETFYSLNQQFGEADPSGKLRECPNCGFYSLMLLPTTQKVWCKVCNAELDINLVDE